MKKIIAFILLVLFILPISAQKTLQPLKSKIEEIIQGKRATVSVAVLAIDGKESLYIRADKKMPMQSVFKFHIAATVLSWVDRGKLSLDQKIDVKKSDLLENTWSPLREKYPEGNSGITLRELIYYTVAWSDNNGCDILLKLIGGVSEVQRFMDLKGVKDFQIKYNEAEMHQSWEVQFENYTTTRSIVMLLKKFQQGKLLSPATTRFLYGVMKQTETGKNKLKEHLPKGSIAHKTGSSGKNAGGMTGAENDMGIVSLPNGKKYAIAVFISQSAENEAVNCEMISQISKMTYQEMLKKLK